MDHVLQINKDLIRFKDLITEYLIIIIIIIRILYYKIIFKHLTILITTIILFDSLVVLIITSQQNVTQPSINYYAQDIACNYYTKDGHDVTNCYKKKNNKRNNSNSGNRYTGGGSRTVTLS